MYKSIIFLHVRYIQLGKKKIPFALATKTLKYQGTNLAKKKKYIYIFKYIYIYLGR